MYLMDAVDLIRDGGFDYKVVVHLPVAGGTNRSSDHSANFAEPPRGREIFGRAIPIPPDLFFWCKSFHCNEKINESEVKPEQIVLPVGASVKIVGLQQAVELNQPQVNGWPFDQTCLYQMRPHEHASHH